MKRKGHTISAKLLGSFAALIAVILAPLGAYLISGRQSHRQLEEVLNRYNRKLDIGTQVELATTEMQGSQRGVMLSYAMNDPGASRQYKDLYATSGTKIDGLMEQLHPLLDNDAEKAAIADIQSNRANWAPRFQKLLETCESGDIDAAYKLRNENKVISAKMHAAATQLAQEQRKALDRVKAASDAAVAASNRIAALVTVLCAAVSAFLLVTVRREVAKLRRAVTDLRQTAGEVATASGQVASSSQAVAQGASEQAASIEETSSSTEQINAMTRRNAEQLGEAAELATRTGSAIEDANRALGEMQASMEEINGACEEVGHIIKVIDEIAFQTNILALNAAVESARAGEAGMGFAVVADEVRNLAQRSAKAASETTGLIEESIAKSRQGRHNLELVSGAIGKLTGSAHQITKLLEQVRNGSAEQSRGVQQISSAMSRIDHVTQGSASAAEETAAVGEEMSAQAATLNEIVQRLHFLVG